MSGPGPVAAARAALGTIIGRGAWVHAPGIRAPRERRFAFFGGLGGLGGGCGSRRRAASITSGGAPGRRAASRNHCIAVTESPACMYALAASNAKLELSG